MGLDQLSLSGEVLGNRLHSWRQIRNNKPVQLPEQLCLDPGHAGLLDRLYVEDAHSGFAEWYPGQLLMRGQVRMAVTVTNMCNSVQHSERHHGTASQHYGYMCV